MSMSHEYKTANPELQATWIASPMTPEECTILFNPNLGLDEDVLSNILVYRCSNCQTIGTRTPYCSNCGAIMDNTEEEIEET